MSTVPEQAVKDMQRKVEQIIEEAQTDAAEIVASRYGLDPTDLEDAYERAGGIT